MQAMSPLNPRLACLMTFGELRYNTSSIFPLGRISSIWRSRRTDAAIDTTRVAAAKAVVRPRAVMTCNSSLESAQSLQIPALKDQHSPAQSHGAIEKGVERVLQNELRAHGLLMGHGADHVQCRKIGH